MTRWRKEGTLLATNSFETEHHCLYSIDSNQVLPATAARLNATHLHLHKSSRGHQVFSIVTTCASLGKASEKSEIYSPCKKNQMSEFRVPKTSLMWQSSPIHPFQCPCLYHLKMFFTCKLSETLIVEERLPLN